MPAFSSSRGSWRCSYQRAELLGDAPASGHAEVIRVAVEQHSACHRGAFALVAKHRADVEDFQALVGAPQHLDECRAGLEACRVRGLAAGGSDFEAKRAPRYTVPGMEAKARCFADDDDLLA